MHRLTKPIAVLATTVAAVAGVALTTTSAASAAKSSSAPVTLRLGYFPNVTHAPAIVGVQAGIFAKQLGNHVTVKYSTFNSGTDELTAFQGGALDAGYIGPNPTITAWTQLDKGVRVISGAASGGAYFVVKAGINSAADLKGKTLATPQLGNTQDVALRNWLKKNGLNTDTSGGGDVKIVPEDNATTLTAFKNGDIQGAWVPEPWATQLVSQGGGKILVDESTLWPGGNYVTTQLIVTTDFLKAHPDVVQKLVNAQVAANDYIHKDTASAETDVSQGIQQITGKAIDGNLVIAAFKNIDFTNDPIASSLATDNATQKTFGFPAASSLKGLYDLTFLNKALKAADEPPVSASLSAKT
jgi:NitT/TauT family transport system substrate-binding protein